MVRSIVGKWQYVYFCDFDKPMTKYLYHELISDLEQIDIKVLGSVCDQAGENEGLKRALGVTKLKPWSTNPHDPTRKVFFFFDFVHVFKNLRNHMLDHSVTLEDGMEINPKKEFKEIQSYCRANEISEGSFIKDIILDCKSSDRQNVGFAVTLLSTKMAHLIRKHFPHDLKKLALADLCEKFHRGILRMKMCIFFWGQTQCLKITKNVSFESSCLIVMNLCCFLCILK